MRSKVLSRQTAIAILAVSLSSCSAQRPVVRSHASAHLPRSGASYIVVPARSGLDPAEFTRRVAVVDDALRERGLVKSANPQSAALLVKMDFGVGRTERRTRTREPIGLFRRHMQNDYSSGLASQRLPAGPSMFPDIQVIETRRDFVELSIVRGSDNAILFRGIATAPNKPAKERPLGTLIQAIFAKWRPQADTTS